MRVRWICVVAFCLGCLRSFSDVLWQKNGRFFEVIVLEQTADRVTFTTGVGRVTVPLSQIDRIEYSTSSKNKQIRSEWADLYFYDDQYVPEALHPLAAQFRTLRSVHAKMLQASRQREVQQTMAVRSERQMSQCTDEIKKLQAQQRQQDALLQIERVRLNELTSEMSRLAGQYNSRRYKGADQVALHEAYDFLRAQRDPQFLKVQKMMTEFRALLTRLDSLKIEYQTLYRSVVSHGNGERDQSELAAYLDARDQFFNDCAACEKDGVSSRFPVVFQRFCRAGEVLDADIQLDQVPISRHGGTLQTTIIVNGGHPATMIVDTGASYTTISRAFALQLNLGPLDLLPRQTVRMADGRSVQAIEVCLESVMAGTIIRKQVSALVMEDPPSDDVDGLLGMSFLEEFVVRLDADQGDLKLISRRE